MGVQEVLLTCECTLTRTTQEMEVLLTWPVPLLSAIVTLLRLSIKETTSSLPSSPSLSYG